MSDPVPTPFLPPYPHLRRAPILEAIIEIKVGVASPVTMAPLEAAARLLQATFARSQRIRQFSAEFSVVDGVAAAQASDGGELGLRLEADAAPWVVQLRRDAVAISRLRPYSKWDDLLACAAEVWHAYAREVGPVEVLRLGVRYINQLPLPSGRVDLDDVLREAPRNPVGLPATIASFALATQFALEEAQCMVTRQLSLASAVAPTGEPLAHLMLDIDAYDERRHAPDWTGLATRLESLRAAKNRTFFASLTADALEAFR